jgi:hypothetical protein
MLEPYLHITLSGNHGITTGKRISRSKCWPVPRLGKNPVILMIVSSRCITGLYKSMGPVEYTNLGISSMYVYG